MGLRVHKPSYTLTLTVALGILLILLAMLQYNWVGQISEREGQAMQASLRERAIGFQEAFNREIRRPYSLFEMSADDLRNERWRAFAERFERWNASAPYRGLVKNLYLAIAKVDRGSEVKLMRFDETSELFEPGDWPANFGGLRERLELQQSPLNKESWRKLVALVEHGYIAGDIPALARFVLVPDLAQQPKQRAFKERMDEPKGRPPGEAAEEAERHALEKRVEEAKRAALRRREEEAKRGAAGNREQEPKGGVLGRLFEKRGYAWLGKSADEPKRAAPGKRVEKPQTGESGYYVGELNRRALDRRVEEPPRRPYELGLVIIELDLEYIKQVFIPTLAKRHFKEGGLPDSDLTIVNRDGPERVIYRSGGPGPDRSLSSQATDETLNILSSAIDPNTTSNGARWQVFIRHQPGSLEAAVARVRLRNLAVSFGILFLLAISVAIIIISSRRAQQLARKQVEFVAGVSHEFRTPLSVIHAISENLADGLVTDTREVEQCGMVIRDDARRLAGMVEQVLELAGAFRGKSLYRRCPVELPKLFDQVLARYGMSGPDKEWRIEKEIEPDLPAVMADPAALGSALRNILDNAIKYGGAERWIGISAHTQASEQSQTVQINIEDKGIGIPPTDLPHIFEPFYRGAEVRAAQIHGNGLGLSLVKNIIEAQGGTITVASTPGRGTSFTLNLPAANGADKTPV